MNDDERDWIAKYRATLDPEQGLRSSAGGVIAAIRRIWQSLVGVAPQATDSSDQAPNAGSPSSKKIAQREGSPPPDARDNKVS